MTIFQHILWGYEITYPDHWSHQQVQDTEIFAAPADLVDSPEAILGTGQVQIRCEWNWARQPIEPLWSRHIGLTAGLLGAKQVGSAPWRLGEARGLEAEIVLPKKDNRRLWTGILMQDFRVLHFLVTHLKEARAEFEPAATRLISSLRFPAHIAGLPTSPEGLPLPPGCVPANPLSILNDIAEPQCWRAYTGAGGVGALQAFYLRELPAHNWQMEEYVPFPGPTDLGFARLQLRKAALQLTLGLMPTGSAETAPGNTAAADIPAAIVYKLSAR